MFFTDPMTGHQHGYYDGWDTAGLFNYVGEGQRGDQQFIRGNRAILQHREDDRTLEGFLATGTEVTYLGEFELVDTFQRDAHETGDGHTLRQVIVFRLRSLNPLPIDLPLTPVTTPVEAVVETVPVEMRHTEHAFVDPYREPYRLERLEGALVDRYQQHLIALGHTVSRLRVIPPGEGAPIFSDLWDHSTAELVEAKSSVTRDHLRTAVGQLFDYRRFVDAQVLTVLVPSQPRPDLRAYVGSTGIDIVYESAGQWIRLQSASAD